MLLKVGNFIDRHWYSMSMGSSLTALLISFLHEHGILILSFSCTALGPLLIKVIYALAEGRQKKEDLRHQRKMNELSEAMAQAELNHYRLLDTPILQIIPELQEFKSNQKIDSNEK